jgi:hypothetical protein
MKPIKLKGLLKEENHPTIIKEAIKESNNILVKSKVLNEAVDVNKLRKLEDEVWDLTTTLEKKQAELEELKRKVVSDVKVTKAGKKMIYTRKDGVTWYSPSAYDYLYWKIEDTFTDKKVVHDDKDYEPLIELPPFYRKLALALYNGPIPKK